MGSLLVEIGQCGCQIGGRLHADLMQYKESSYLKRLKSDTLHAILIDTEPKILKPIQENRKDFYFLDPSNIKFFQHGRGNNWSYGYLDARRVKKQQPQPLQNVSLLSNRTFSQAKPASFTEKYYQENSQIIEFTLDAIRKEIQRTDCFLGINLICSLGGGTGSGLGTRLCEEIKENMRIRILAHAVLPNMSGETPLQHYNCALSLASMVEHSDAILTYENDKMTSLFSEGDGSLDQINGYIAHCISSLLRLNDSPKYGRFYFDLVQECTLTPELKFLELYVSYKENRKERSKLDWEQVMADTFRQVANANRDDYRLVVDKQKTLHTEIVARGKDPLQIEQYDKKLQALLNPVSEANFEQIEPKNPERECLMLTSRTRILRYLRHLVEKGEQKLKLGAYTWNYKVPLEPAFERLHDLIYCYEMV